LFADTVLPILDSSGLIQQYCFTSQGVYKPLAEIYIIYLDFLYDINISKEVKSKREKRGDYIVDFRAFLGYAANDWGIYTHTACISADTDLIAFIINIDSLYSSILAVWLKVYWDTI
jgi:hypothetical protein